MYMCTVEYLLVIPAKNTKSGITSYPPGHWSQRPEGRTDHKDSLSMYSDFPHGINFNRCQVNQPGIMAQSLCEGRAGGIPIWSGSN